MNKEAIINWFNARKGRVTYSMANRNGPASYDCSSAVYHALIEAGFLPQGYRIGNTDSLFNDLEGHGWRQVPVNASGDADTHRGDIFIWGKRGASGGAFGHCLPYDNTELMTPTGWKKLQDFKVGDPIMQFNKETGRIEPTTVQYVQEPFLDKVYRRRKVEATDGHRMLTVEYTTDNYTETQWKYIKDKNVCLPKATTDSGVVGEISKLSTEELSLLAAIQADGTYEGNRVRFHLKKERKIVRLEMLLETLGIEYHKSIQKAGSTKISFTVPEIAKKYLPNKVFTKDWLGINREQALHLAEEIQLWDGSVSHRDYCSTIEQNVDILQQALFMNGVRCHKSKDCRTYRLNMPMGKYYTSTGKYRTEHGLAGERETLVGCVSVPSTYIISRQFGAPQIVGNTGVILDDAGNIIHCSSGYDGIHVDNHDWLWELNGCPAYTFYTYVGNAPSISDDRIRQVYREVLERGADAGGLAHYRSQISKGWTLDQVRQDLLNSDERRRLLASKAAAEERARQEAEARRQEEARKEEERKRKEAELAKKAIEEAEKRAKEKEVKPEVKPLPIASLSKDEFKKLLENTDMKLTEGEKFVVPDKVRMGVYLLNLIGAPLSYIVFNSLAVTKVMPVATSEQLVAVIVGGLGMLAGAMGVSHFTRTK